MKRTFNLITAMLLAAAIIAGSTACTKPDKQTMANTEAPTPSASATEGATETPNPTETPTPTPTPTEEPTEEVTEAPTPIDTTLVLLENPSDYAEEMALVQNYWDLVDQGKWLEWANLYAPVERDESLNFVNNEENYTNNVGLLTVSSVKLCNAVLVEDEAASMFYKELIPYYDDPNTVACYLVELDMTVNVDNGYFSNGKSRHVMILVKDDGVWYVGAMYLYNGD